MRVVYTKHAKGKFKILKELNIKVRRTDISNALGDPDFHGVDVDRNAEFVLKKINNALNLRVIYAKKHDIIIVITFHPTEGGRYIK